ncbi:MAG: ribonuclease catalytic domain-containing protein [Treponema sp.]|nr:ribonuclease catalytic domain-containing protein [Treponema sp.]
MINENALVIYKNKPAIVIDRADGKYTITLTDGEQVKVRDKDIELIHPGPVKNFSEIEIDNPPESSIKEAWELLLEENDPMSLKDLTNLIFSEYKPSTAFAVYSLLKDGLYFNGTIDAIIPRKKEDVENEESKRGEKLRETEERSGFINRIKACLKNPSGNVIHSDDFRFMQDVEALAFGKSTKSRTLKDLGLSETPEDAHNLLLKTNFWTPMVNPHPVRFGLSLNNAVVCPDAPLANEQRQNLCHLKAFAIDNSWSNDPDDAISLTEESGKTIFYVHIADPASSITFDSPCEKEAKDRGATLYIPEGTYRMLADDSIPLFALGLSGKSPVLTFKMTIDTEGYVIDTEIFPSIVNVRRLTYEQADKEMEENSEDGAILRSLYDLTQKIFNRRAAQGAINIEYFDVHIFVENETVKIEQEIHCKSASIVKECMITAGEGTGTWAASRGLAFPYISQEIETQPDNKQKDLGGIAGSFQLRRCMRPRVLSVKPGRHQGLGLETYTQVTSPLRRYTDLLSHIQIRKVLRGEKPLSADDISMRLGFGEAASSAVIHAERASNNHWVMVYLLNKINSGFDAIAIENKGNRWLVLIPSIALEIQIPLQKKVSPNETIKLVLKSVNISKGEAVFIHSV